MCSAQVDVTLGTDTGAQGQREEHEMTQREPGIVIERPRQALRDVWITLHTVTVGRCYRTARSLACPWPNDIHTNRSTGHSSLGSGPVNNRVKEGEKKFKRLICYSIPIAVGTYAQQIDRTLRC